MITGSREAVFSSDPTDKTLRGQQNAEGTLPLKLMGKTALVTGSIIYGH
jgi:hypothetical protein